MAVFSFSTGLCQSGLVALAPKLVSNYEKESSGFLINFFSEIGVLLGLCLANLLSFK